MLRRKQVPRSLILRPGAIKLSPPTPPSLSRQLSTSWQSAAGKVRKNARTDGRTGKKDMPKSRLVRRNLLTALGLTKPESAEFN